MAALSRRGCSGSLRVERAADSSRSFNQAEGLDRFCGIGTSPRARVDPLRLSSSGEKIYHAISLQRRRTPACLPKAYLAVVMDLDAPTVRGANDPCIPVHLEKSCSMARYAPRDRRTAGLK